MKKENVLSTLNAGFINEIFPTPWGILHSFASKCMLYIHIPEELQLDRERQKAFFRLQQQ